MLLAPVALPAVVKVVGGYLVTAGSAAVAVSQMAVDGSGGCGGELWRVGCPAAAGEAKTAQLKGWFEEVLRDLFLFAGDPVAGAFWDEPTPEVFSSNHSFPAPL